jgi:hypothetical protein
MNPRLLMKSLLTAIALGGGITLGCVIGEDNCPGIHNYQSGTECFCDAGYTWEDPDDPDNKTCVSEEPKEGQCDQPNNIVIGDECHCDDGFDWCSSDPNDFSCCEIGGHGDDGSGGSDDVADDAGTDTGGVDTGGTGESGVVDDTGNDSGVEPDPADCTEDGLSFCSNTEEMGPEGSRYWICMGGEWMENTTAGDESCAFDEFDFAYGCVSTEGAVQFVCGDGPGTACDGDAAMCVDGDLIQYCLYDKLTEDSCMRICTEDGDEMGVTYEYGECSADTNECFCCDAGEPDCPAGM